MATEVNLPALGESVTEGTVTRWLKQVGDTIAVDEPLLEVSTDKVDTEIPSPVAGTLLEIRAEEDDTVEVGAVLAIVGDADEGSGDSGSTDDAATPEAQPKDEEQAEKKAEQEQEIVEEKGELPPGDETPEAEKPASPAASGGSGGSGGGSGEGTPVTLPALGESVTEGTVTRWLKQVGDEVAVDEPLLEVSTDKVDTEIPSPVAGTLLEIKADEDETVEVGAELAIIGSGSPAPSAPAAEPTPEPEPEPEPEPKQAEEPAPAAEPAKPAASASTPAPEQPAQSAPAPSAPSAASSSSSEESSTYVTPLVRKLAAQHDVDLSTVTGSGVGGRIRKQDVLDAAAKAKEAAAAPAAAAPAAQPATASAPSAPSTTPSPLRGTTEKMSRLRKVIASRMVESLQGSAQLTQVVEVDVTRIARLRDSVKADFLAREGVKLSYLPFFAKAAVEALKQHPALNASIEGDEVTYHDRENLSFAVDTPKGLITPVVKDAGDLSISGLAKKIADVAQRTRTNKIGPDDLSGGTFTITNLGSVGALWDTPIINAPQVAILGPGAVVKRPVVIDDPNLGETIAVRHMVYLALTYDHRLVDGADAGRFLQDVKQRLEAGQFEV
ncbi:2-oxoglutarate dehydrogenase, E2 component, dihydrolipoamide succinyltransferase [Nocardioides sp. ChNu-99]|uniref:2-oxoglutarate dehydrogenase, E2 component, dihydrolipoamide succinyltransferase n=1 Tax=Nocardioides sp. ChNu-99 TaxID=2839897 RepID=UPI002404B0A0|nr:2-oxoglutarate dehydrogenase, E2 component, dihydrolipoamide succinyltransferase [Nocardioides sp. ChNu-99]MDF9715702.1 2-oxoglutarate dehydrogenase, E2 component, dihydrolipoamide succinyltransferase [Nocardioides sp. ChNu-99]